MSSQSSSDVQRFRNETESNAEWRLREMFLKAHQGKFDENRLVCLSNCYVNMEIYGCKYPEETMAQVRELTAELKQD